MHELKIVDESFDLKLTSEYHLSIQVGLDGFSFCILHIRRNKYVMFRHIPLAVGKYQFLTQKLNGIFEQEEVLNQTFHSVLVTFSTYKVSLVPREFARADLASIVTFVGELSRSEDVKADELPGFSDLLSYGYPKELLSFLNSKYTEFNFRHKSIPLFHSAIRQRGDENTNTLVINFEKKYIRVVALSGSDILLYNSFYYKNETDFLYHILNVFQSLQLDPEADKILIGGFVADDSAYIRNLKKYLRNISFLSPSPDFNYGSIFDKIQKHQFVTLFNSYLCV